MHTCLLNVIIMDLENQINLWLGSAVLSITATTAVKLASWKCLSNSRACPPSVDLLFYQQTLPLQEESRQLLR